MRRRNSEQEWDKEAEFCESEAARKLLIGSFESYCRMQANFAWSDGCEVQARRIAKSGGIEIDTERHRQWQENLEKERVRVYGGLPSSATL